MTPGGVAKCAHELFSKMREWESHKKGACVASFPNVLEPRRLVGVSSCVASWCRGPELLSGGTGQTCLDLGFYFIFC